MIQMNVENKSATRAIILLQPSAVIVFKPFELDNGQRKRKKHCDIEDFFDILNSERTRVQHASELLFGDDDQ